MLLSYPRDERFQPAGVRIRNLVQALHALAMRSVIEKVCLKLVESIEISAFFGQENLNTCGTVDKDWDCLVFRDDSVQSSYSNESSFRA